MHLPTLRADAAAPIAFSWHPCSRVSTAVDLRMEIDLLGKAHARRPSDYAHMVRYAKSLAYQRKGDEAVDVCRAFCARHPEHAKAPLQLADLLRELLRFEEALAALEDASDAVDAASRYGLAAYLCQLLGREADARTFLDRAMAASSPGPFALRWILRALIDQERFAEAVAYYEALAPALPYDTWAHAFASQAACRVPGALRDAYLDYPALVGGATLTAAPDGGPLGAFNAAIHRHIAAHPRLLFPANKAVHEGMQVFLGEAHDDAVSALLGWCKAQVEAYVRRPAVARHLQRFGPVAEAVRLNAWGVILREEGRQLPHIHANGIVSGVYYVDVPAHIQRSTALSEGWLYLHEDSEPEDHRHAVRPEDGRLVLFPSYLHHATVPLATDAPRVCVAFDVVPAAQEGPPLTA